MAVADEQDKEIIVLGDSSEEEKVNEGDDRLASVPGPDAGTEKVNVEFRESISNDGNQNPTADAKKVNDKQARVTMKTLRRPELPQLRLKTKAAANARTRSSISQKAALESIKAIRKVSNADPDIAPAAWMSAPASCDRALHQNTTEASFTRPIQHSNPYNHPTETLRNTNAAAQSYPDIGDTKVLFPPVYPHGSDVVSMAPSYSASTTLTASMPSQKCSYDRYNQANNAVILLERSINALNHQAMKLTLCNVVQAQQILKDILVHERKLRVLIVKRDICVVNIILTSQRLLDCVHRLRLNCFSDNDQVISASHLKCDHIAQQLTIIERNLGSLQENMESLVNGAFASADYHRKLLELNQSIEEHEQSIATWKMEREREMVNIVRNSKQIRDLLQQQYRRCQDMAGLEMT